MITLNMDHKFTVTGPLQDLAILHEEFGRSFGDEFLQREGPRIVLWLWCTNEEARSYARRVTQEYPNIMIGCTYWSEDLKAVGAAVYVIGEEEMAWGPTARKTTEKQIRQELQDFVDRFLKIHEAEINTRPGTG